MTERNVPVMTRKNGKTIQTGSITAPSTFKPRHDQSRQALNLPKASAVGKPHPLDVRFEAELLFK